jgi:hypothetical protein
MVSYHSAALLIHLGLDVYHFDLKVHRRPHLTERRIPVTSMVIKMKKYLNPND